MRGLTLVGHQTSRVNCVGLSVLATDIFQLPRLNYSTDPFFGGDTHGLLQLKTRYWQFTLHFCVSCNGDPKGLYVDKGKLDIVCTTYHSSFELTARKKE